MAPAWNCQVCGAGEPRHLVTQGGFRWVECPGCGFVCLDPMPSFEAARQNENAGLGGFFIREYTRKGRSKMRRSKRRVRRLKRRMAGERLLDVGCNVGYLLEAARRQGLEAVGVETNPILVAHAAATLPGNRFICGSIEEADLDADSFDCVYTSEVIEHLVDVNSFLAGIARVAPAGRPAVSDDAGTGELQARPRAVPLAAPERPQSQALLQPRQHSPPARAPRLRHRALLRQLVAQAGNQAVGAAHLRPAADGACRGARSPVAA